MLEKSMPLTKEPETMEERGRVKQRGRGEGEEGGEERRTNTSQLGLDRVRRGDHLNSLQKKLHGARGVWFCSLPLNL